MLVSVVGALQFGWGAPVDWVATLFLFLVVVLALSALLAADLVAVRFSVAVATTTWLAAESVAGLFWFAVAAFCCSQQPSLD